LYKGNLICPLYKTSAKEKLNMPCPLYTTAVKGELYSFLLQNCLKKEALFFPYIKVLYKREIKLLLYISFL
jgi:hypothetical protein